MTLFSVKMGLDKVVLTQKTPPAMVADNKINNVNKRRMAELTSITSACDRKAFFGLLLRLRVGLSNDARRRSWALSVNQIGCSAQLTNL